MKTLTSLVLLALCVPLADAQLFRNRRASACSSVSSSACSTSAVASTTAYVPPYRIVSADGMSVSFPVNFLSVALQTAQTWANADNRPTNVVDSSTPPIVVQHFEPVAAQAKEPPKVIPAPQPVQDKPPVKADPTPPAPPVVVLQPPQTTAGACTATTRTRVFQRTTDRQGLLVRFRARRGCGG